MDEVIIINTGKANISSVITGLIRAGAKSRLSDKVSDIKQSSYVVLPGVGAFGAAMKQLLKMNLVEAIRERILEGKPTLAICLGLHLLAEQSEEAPDVSGLGIIPGTIKRFKESPKIPQLGWNNISITEGCNILRDGYAYFANSFYLPEAPPGWRKAKTTYGETFISAIEKDAVLACQFHPELSGSWGRDLLVRWLREGKRSC